MTDIDPVAFGALQAEVTALRRDMHEMRGETHEMRGEIRALVAMAERSKGALFAGMSIASVAGGVVTWAVQHWIGKGP